jgi:hypothetical protein
MFRLVSKAAVLLCLLSLYFAAPVGLAAQQSTSYLVSNQGTVNLVQDPPDHIPPGLALKYRTDFETVTKATANTLNMGIPNWFEFDNGNNMWIDAGTQRTNSPPAHSGSKCIGMEVLSGIRAEFNIMDMQNIVGNEYYISVWVYLPSDWSSPGTDNWYSLNDLFMGGEHVTPYPYYPYSETYISQSAPNVFSIDHDIRDRTTGSQYEVPLANNPNFPLPRGRWFKTEWYIYRHVTNGIVRVWIDGIKTCDRTGTPASPVKTVNANSNEFFITITKIYGSVGALPNPYRLWTDDFEIYGT